MCIWENVWEFPISCLDLRKDRMQDIAAPQLSTVWVQMKPNLLLNTQVSGRAHCCQHPHHPCPQLHALYSAPGEKSAGSYDHGQWVCCLWADKGRAHMQMGGRAEEMSSSPTWSWACLPAWYVKGWGGGRKDLFSPNLWIFIAGSSGPLLLTTGLMGRHEMKGKVTWTSLSPTFNLFALLQSQSWSCTLNSSCSPPMLKPSVGL